MTTSTPWLNDKEQTVWRTWLHAHVSLNAALSRQLSKESGLTLAEYEVLVVLSEAPDHRLRMAALAKMIQWDRSRLSHQITRMTKRGFVRRTDCAEDGRGAFVQLEPQGLTAIQAAAPGHVAQVRENLFAPLTEKETAQLGELLSKIDAQFTP
ncbi:MarR family transcriptional regulator [Corynebacterium sp. zg254]|uniref:MarR family transcriptional regulator n=1 Tax=Corynebacterium zhongnanshanii TaxID=2768834 RepID=A0ABQ6VBT6_9CORY|nr:MULTISPECIES: MarR family transcriptional regulator [Corynebacterium]KAB3519211.1 MarR family transcriptional regulator [Corynebacterium zhongnanshanii]MCR5915064.1 MarR family transcriptional regulator [Corynebacterium sp. zg254]